MVTYILRLRLIILARALWDLGWWRLSILSLLIISTLAYLVLITTTVVQAILVAGFAISVVGALHLARGDARFLKIAAAPDRDIFVTEYLLGTAPISVALIMSGQLSGAVAIIVGCLLLPNLATTGSRVHSARRYRTRLPTMAFEWTAGFRKTRMLFAALYLLAAAFVQFPLSVPIVLVVLATLSTTFFHESEGRGLVEIFNLSPVAFILRKVGLALTIFWALCIPLIVLHLSLASLPLLFLAAVVVGCSILLATAVVAKYAFYDEGRRHSNPHSTVISISLASMLLFVPSLVAVALLVWLYLRARRNLAINLAPVRT